MAALYNQTEVNILQNGLRAMTIANEVLIKENTDLMQEIKSVRFENARIKEKALDNQEEKE